jgi:hypothetical protein
MASGSASYSTNATNYGRNSADAYYYLSAPDTINGPLTVTGNLHVQGTSQLDGAVTCGSTLNTAGNIVAGGAANATITAAGPGGNVQLNPIGGGFPSVEFTNGAGTTLVGLQSPTNLIVGNNGVSVGMPGAVNVGGDLSVGGSSHLNLGTGSYLVNQGTNILANVGGAAAFSIEAARVSALVPLAVGSLVAGSLGATAPVVPTLFGTSGDAQWKNTGAGVDQATFVIAGYRVIFGTSALAGGNAATTVNFTTPFALTCMPIVLCQSMTAGSSPPLSGFVQICQSGAGTGASPTRTSFQAQGVQAGGSSFPASFCWIAIGAA